VTHTATSLAALLDKYGLAPSRALGQNFVVDPNTVRRIARLSRVGDGDDVLEIGAGLGSLTLALAETGARVVALEADRYLIAPLTEVVAGRDVQVVHGDALKIDLAELIGDRPHVVVANLPYNVATTIVLRVLEEAPLVPRMLVMVQSEVAERLAAGAGDDAYGAVSVRVTYFATARLVGSVSATVFRPVPRVASSLVEITRRDAVAIDPDHVSEAALFEVVETAFAHRRKMLRRSLAQWATPGVFDRAGIAATRRPEELTISEFARLASER
jgi:16S rRNA (adenine1518-N6/adenine1519-N6)-dimethyltransferase